MASPVSAEADPEHLRRAVDAVTRLQLAERALEAARWERDQAIMTMLDQGVSLGRVAAALGMSRALVQQTRERIARARARASRGDGHLTRQAG